MEEKTNDLTVIIAQVLNEMKKDTGVDAVILNGEQIIEIVQIKHHRSNAPLRQCEFKTFLAKASQPRYANIRKRLIVNNCEIGPRVRKTIRDSGIVLDQRILNQ